MNYEEYKPENEPETHKNPGSGLVVIVTVAMLIVVLSVLFTLTRLRGMKNQTDNTASLTSSSGGNIISPSSSSNNTVSDIPKTVPMEEQTEKKVSSVPFENSSSEKAPETPTFTLPVEGEIIKDFSNKELQYSKTFGDMRLHSGIDISCKNGTSVSACANGTVTSVEDTADYGKVVTVDHGNGLTAKYSAINDVKFKSGDKLVAGDIIGTVTTVPAECNDQEHLHFEVYKNGIAVSPTEALGIK